MREARREYGTNANIEIKNIDIIGKANIGTWLYAFAPYAVVGPIAHFASGDGLGALYASPALFIPNLVGHFQKITATGDVVMVSGGGVTRISQQRPKGAVDRAAETLLDSMPHDSTIAILNVNSMDSVSAEFIIDELEFIIVNSRRFRIVDRRRLEQIRIEQNFQLSGDVSDDSAVSIGNMLGASIVITGDITDNRLVLRVLDVQTAQIIAMAREQF